MLKLILPPLVSLVLALFSTEANACWRELLAVLCPCCLDNVPLSVWMRNSDGDVPGHTSVVELELQFRSVGQLARWFRRQPAPERADLRIVFNGAWAAEGGQAMQERLVAAGIPRDQLGSVEAVVLYDDQLEDLWRFLPLPPLPVLHGPPMPPAPPVPPVPGVAWAVKMPGSR